MRKLAVLSFVTLDGVMQSPSAPEEDPSGGFDQGGWAVPFWEGVMGHVQETAMARPYDILFGRRTYDIFAAHWPNAPKSDVGDMLDRAQKHVATSKPMDSTWENTNVLHGDTVQAVQDLKAQDGPLLQVHGSAALIQSLLAASLIDEFRIWMFPVVVGRGKRLFGEGTIPSRLQPCSAKALDNGVMHQVLRPL